MEKNNLRLFWCFALLAAASAHWAPDPYDEQPTNVEYLDAGIQITKDIGYFTNKTRGASLQYINGVATLNWETNLENELGQDLMVHLIINKKYGENCWRTAYDSGLISFCKNVPKEVSHYVDILGFYASDPPILDCPYPAGTYKLKDFKPETSRLKNIERGHLAIDYSFVMNGQMVIRLTADVIVS